MCFTVLIFKKKKKRDFSNDITVTFYCYSQLRVDFLSQGFLLINHLPTWWFWELELRPDQFLGQEDPLKKGITTHSSILAWRIPWTDEPGRLQSMWSQRVGTTERLRFTVPSHCLVCLRESFPLLLSSLRQDLQVPLPRDCSCQLPSNNLVLQPVMLPQHH